jgi:hypothetical protein
MTKQLRDVFKGVKSSTTAPLKLDDDLAPRAKGDRDFIAKHEVEKHADRAGNTDAAYKSSKEKVAHKKAEAAYEEVEGVEEGWKYLHYPSHEHAVAARKAHHEWRDKDGMRSGNAARLMPNGKVAYQGEFKGPKPPKKSKTNEEAERVDEVSKGLLSRYYNKSGPNLDHHKHRTSVHASAGMRSKDPVKKQEHRDAEDHHFKQLSKRLHGRALSAMKIHGMRGAKVHATEELDVVDESMYTMTKRGDEETRKKVDDAVAKGRVKKVASKGKYKPFLGFSNSSIRGRNNFKSIREDADLIERIISLVERNKENNEKKKQFVQGLGSGSRTKAIRQGREQLKKPVREEVEQIDELTGKGKIGELRNKAVKNLEKSVVHRSKDRKTDTVDYSTAEKRQKSAQYDKNRADTLHSMASKKRKNKSADVSDGFRRLKYYKTVREALDCSKNKLTVRKFEDSPLDDTIGAALKNVPGYKDGTKKEQKLDKKIVKHLNSSEVRNNK